MSTTTFHERRKAERMRDPEFRAEYERARREVEQIDSVVRSLDDLRERVEMSKAELARRIGRNASSIRRLFTSASNPELRLMVQIANELDADLAVIPRRRRSQRGRGSRSTQSGRKPAQRQLQHTGRTKTPVV